MVVVVKFFAPNQDAPRHDVGAGIGSLEIAVTPIVSYTIDDTGGSDGIQSICTAQTVRPTTPNNIRLITNMMPKPCHG